MPELTIKLLVPGALADTQEGAVELGVICAVARADVARLSDEEITAGLSTMEVYVGAFLAGVAHRYTQIAPADLGKGYLTGVADWFAREMDRK